MYNNTQELDKAIQEFLSVPEQYDIAKQTALNIMVKASAENKPEFAENLDSTIGIVCTLHLLHGLSFQQIEAEAQYMIAGEIDVDEEGQEDFNL